MVNTVALRNTTGRPEGKESLFTTAFWLMLLTSLSSGSRTRSRPYNACWIQVVSYLLPHFGSRVVIPTFKRPLEEMNGVRITDICPPKKYYTIERSVSRTSLRCDRGLLTHGFPWKSDDDCHLGFTYKEGNDLDIGVWFLLP